jgi:hypothetical protein
MKFTTLSSSLIQKPSGGSVLICPGSDISNMLSCARVIGWIDGIGLIVWLDRLGSNVIAELSYCHLSELSGSKDY